MKSGKRNWVIERKPKSFLLWGEQVTLLEQEIIPCKCAMSEHSIKHTSLLTTVQVTLLSHEKQEFVGHSLLWSLKGGWTPSYIHIHLPDSRRWKVTSIEKALQWKTKKSFQSRLNDSLCWFKFFFYHGQFMYKNIQGNYCIKFEY